MSSNEKSSFADECQEHLNWMQSLLNSSSSPAPAAPAASNINYQNEIDSLIASIEQPSTVRQPKMSDVCAQYQDIDDSAYRQSIEPSPLNPARPNKRETKQYRISDPVNSSDSEYDSECEEYYVEDAAEIRGQEIPEWARQANLINELERQQSVDPDKIFSNFEKTCDLSELFEKKKKCFKVRGDSGWWAADGVTPDEELNYKKAVGLA